MAKSNGSSEVEIEQLSDRELLESIAGEMLNMQAAVTTLTEQVEELVEKVSNLSLDTDGYRVFGVDGEN